MKKSLGFSGRGPTLFIWLFGAVSTFIPAQSNGHGNMKEISAPTKTVDKTRIGFIKLNSGVIFRVDHKTKSVTTVFMTTNDGERIFTKIGRPISSSEIKDYLIINENLYILFKDQTIRNTGEVNNSGLWIFGSKGSSIKVNSHRPIISFDVSSDKNLIIMAHENHLSLFDSRSRNKIWETNFRVQCHLRPEDERYIEFIRTFVWSEDREYAWGFSEISYMYQINMAVRINVKNGEVKCFLPTPPLLDGVFPMSLDWVFNPQSGQAVWSTYIETYGEGDRPSQKKASLWWMEFTTGNRKMLAEDILAPARPVWISRNTIEFTDGLRRKKLQVTGKK